MAEVIVKVEGLEELKRQIEGLNEKFQRRVLDQGVSAAARIIRNAASSKAPKDTGLLKRAIRIGKVRQLSFPGKSVYHVFISPKVKGTRQKKGKSREIWAFYWRFLEFGTRKMAARPFLRPAFDENREQALKAMADKFRSALEKYRG